ncbi:MAG: tetratricopeptide repeat protein [Ruminococcaceae bacterium]|nr:tetratricopeptide repeat protein [Oscillospiraceae bacterium]
MNRNNIGFFTFLKFLFIGLGLASGVWLFSMCRTELEALILILVIIVFVTVLATVSEKLNEHFSLRRAAMKALGMHGGIAIRKDATARVVYKGIIKLMQDDYHAAEEYLMKAYHLSDVRNNQLFCIEWLVRLYEALESTPSATIDSPGKLMWCFRRAAELAPDSPEAQSRLGHAYYVEGKLDKALYCFEQAVKYDPNHGYSHYSIAKIYACRGDDEKAVEILEKLIEMQQNHPLVYCELATIYAMHRSNEKCREYYEKAIMCGYENADKLARRITAIYDFNNAKDADGNDLPQEYYRHIHKEEEKKDCSTTCEHCDLNKKCAKEENNAGNE